MTDKFPATLIDYPSSVLIDQADLAKVKTIVRDALKQLSAKELKTGLEYFTDSDWVDACEQAYQEKFVTMQGAEL